MAFTYNSNVLSGLKYSPALVGASLSATGVLYLTGNNVPIGEAKVILATVDSNVLGVAFNKQVITYPLTGAVNTALNLVSFALNNTTLYIPKALDNTTMALVLAPVNNVQNYVVFTFLSAAASTAFVSLCSITTQVSYPHKQRMHMLGYL